MHKKARTRIASKADINITPFIDILLVLLVIFMTITPKVTQGLDTPIPQPAPPDRPIPPNQPDLLTVYVEQADVIKINSEPVSLAGLGERLKVYFGQRPDHTMFISADPELDFQAVVRVIDIAKGIGADKIGLMTQRPLN